MVSVRGTGRYSPLQLILALLLVAAVAIAFGASLRNEFVSWDDQWYVVENNHLIVQSPGDILWFFTHSYYWSYIPLTLLSHALDYAIWGREPFGHHLSSLMLHAANSVWLFALILTLFRIVRRSGTEASQFPAAFGAFAGALLFALHPLRVESVAWVSDRKDLLCAFFLLPALVAYLRARASSADTSRRGWMFLSVGLFVCALLSKATALMVPIVLVLLERLLLERGSDREDLRASVVRVLPFGLASLIVGAVGLASTPAQTLNFLTLDLSPAQKMLLPFHTIISPLGTLLWPDRLGPIYDYPDGVLTMLLSLVMVLLVSGAAMILARMRHQEVALAWSVYLVMSMPTALFFLSGIQPLADRYSYLTMTSIMILAAAGVTQILRAGSRPLVRALVVAGIAGLAVALGAVSQRQVGTWRSSLTLWSHAVRVAPASAVAFNNLGQAHIEAGALEEATLAFSVASRLKPDYADVYNNMGVASIMRGNAREGRRLLERARSILEAGPSAGPDLPDVYRNLGRVHYELGELDSALASYRRCIALQPQDGLAWHGLSEVLEAMGYGDEALRASERAASLGNADARRTMQRARTDGQGMGEKLEDPP